MYWEYVKYLVAALNGSPKPYVDGICIFNVSTLWAYVDEEARLCLIEGLKLFTKYGIKCFCLFSL